MNNRKRYTINDVNSNRFYQLPKFLFEAEFKNLSNDAKVLYALLRDRHELSLQNNWINEKNEVYLIYTREEMANMLGITMPTLRKAIKELKDFGLMEEERIGLNRANRIYLTSVDLENGGQKNFFTPEGKNFSVRTEKNFPSREKNSFSQECKNFSPNDTEYNDTNYNDTEIDLSINRDNSLNPLTDKSTLISDGPKDLLTIKIKELEEMGYHNIESIKEALTLLWNEGSPGIELKTIREKFNKINYEVIDTAWYKFSLEYEKKDIKHPLKYFASCIYNSITEKEIHRFCNSYNIPQD